MISQRDWASKDDYAHLRFLVNEEYAGAIPVRCAPKAGFVADILRPTLFEVRVGLVKLAECEHFTSVRRYYEAHILSFFGEPPPSQAVEYLFAGAGRSCSVA